MFSGNVAGEPGKPPVLNHRPPCSTCCVLNDNTPSRTERQEEDFLVMGQAYIHVMLHLHDHPVKRCSPHFTDEVTET